MGVESGVTESAGRTPAGRAGWARAYLVPLIVGYAACVPLVAGLIYLERAGAGRATEALRRCLVLGLGVVGLAAFAFIIRGHETRHGRRSKVLRACWGILLGVTALGGVATAFLAMI